MQQNQLNNIKHFSRTFTDIKISSKLEISKISPKLDILVIEYSQGSIGNSKYAHHLIYAKQNRQNNINQDSN
jgi:hypothetical protein